MSREELECSPQASKRSIQDRYTGGHKGRFLDPRQNHHQPPGGRRPRHGQGISLCITPEVDKGSLLAVRASRYTITIFRGEGEFCN
jgi:hypothetical protein